MIYINDKSHAFEQTLSLAELLLQVNIDTQKGIAVALNNNVIPREKWDVQTVNDNDKLLIIKATQGG